MSKEDDVLEFDLELKELPLRCKMPGSDQYRTFVLVEMNGSQRDRYLNSVKKVMKQDGKGAVLGDFTAFQANLLSKCLYETGTPDGERVLLTVEELQTFPSSLLSQLFTRAQKLSGLNLSDEEKEELKNN